MIYPFLNVSDNFLISDDSFLCNLDITFISVFWMSFDDSLSWITVNLLFFIRIFIFDWGIKISCSITCFDHTFSNILFHYVSFENLLIQNTWKEHWMEISHNIIVDTFFYLVTSWLEFCVKEALFTFFVFMIDFVNQELHETYVFSFLKILFNDLYLFLLVFISRMEVYWTKFAFQFVFLEFLLDIWNVDFLTQSFFHVIIILLSIITCMSWIFVE